MKDLSALEKEIIKDFDAFFKEQWDNAMNKHWAGEWLTADRSHFERQLLSALRKQRGMIVDSVEKLTEYPASQSRTEDIYLVNKQDVISIIKEDYEIRTLF